MVFASGFSWFHLIPGVSDDTLFGPLAETLGFAGSHETHVWVAACAACLTAISLSFLGRLGLERARKKQGIERYFADGGLSFRNTMELFVLGMKSMMGDVLGARDVRLFVSAIGATFLYILLSNFMALVPGFLPPTDNMTNNAAMALMSFLLFMCVGLGRNPVYFVKHLMGPVLLLAPFMFLIEVLGLVLRPLTLSFRLSGNMFGDHKVFEIMSSLVVENVGFVGHFLPIPAVFLALGLIVSIIQAFVFSLLSSIYIGLSVPHDDHGDH